MNFSASGNFFAFLRKIFRRKQDFSQFGLDFLRLFGYNMLAQFRRSGVAASDPLAQSVEHLTFNQGVRGSNPRWITKKAVRRQCGVRFFLCAIGSGQPRCRAPNIHESPDSGSQACGKSYREYSFRRASVATSRTVGGLMMVAVFCRFFVAILRLIVYTGVHRETLPKF